MNAEKDKCTVTGTPAPIHCTLSYYITDVVEPLNMGKSTLIMLPNGTYTSPGMHLSHCMCSYICHADILLRQLA